MRETITDLIVTIRAATLCRVGIHSRRRITKLDGGKLPQLCCYCRVILGWGKDA